MTAALTARNVREVADWIQRWRGPDDRVEVETTPTMRVIVRRPGKDRGLVYDAGSIRRLVRG